MPPTNLSLLNLKLGCAPLAAITLIHPRLSPILFTFQSDRTVFEYLLPL